MRSPRRYSNVQFTKRVDYDGGRHRPAKAPKGVLVCRSCGAVYLKRRWVEKSEARALPPLEQVHEATCPACAMQAKGVVGGYLTLGGAFFVKHRQEIETLVKHEAARAAEDNPTGRILSWDRGRPGQITLATTTEHLVERLGRAVRKAYDGTIDFGFSHGNKFARASWRRD